MVFATVEEARKDLKELYPYVQFVIRTTEKFTSAKYRKKHSNNPTRYPLVSIAGQIYSVLCLWIYSFPLQSHPPLFIR
jgi:hypothetical protein